MDRNKPVVFLGITGVVCLALLLGAQGGTCLPSATTPAGGSDSSPVVTGSCEDNRETGSAERVLPVFFPGNPNVTDLSLPPVRPDCVAFADCEISSDAVLQPSDVSLVVQTSCGMKGNWENHEILLTQTADPELKAVAGTAWGEPQENFAECLDPAAESFGLPFYSGEMRIILTREETAYHQTVWLDCEYEYSPFPSWKADDCTITDLKIVNNWTERMDVTAQARSGTKWSATVDPGEEATFRLPPGYYTITDRRASGAASQFQGFVRCAGGTVTYKDVEGEFTVAVDYGVVSRGE